MQTYRTSSGKVIEFPDLEPQVAGFLDRVFTALADPSTSAEQMTDLIYSTANPIMDARLVPHKGYVTWTLLKNPVYQVMVDLLYRKRGIEQERQGSGA